MQQNDGASEKKSLPESGRPLTDNPPPSGPSDASHSIPSISLPKGGGAIRGIGEKFAANPATGTGSLTLPIYMSPGRAGAGPKLSLTYDSGSGNSPFGFGWSTALPSITRKTDKGLPQYADAQGSDIFIFNRSRFFARFSAATWTKEPGAVRFPVNRFGKPKVEGGGIHLSTSHSDGLAVLALSCASIGVDVEKLRPVPDARPILASFFSPTEQAQLAALGSTQSDLDFLSAGREGVLRQCDRQRACRIHSTALCIILAGGARVCCDIRSQAPGILCG